MQKIVKQIRVLQKRLGYSFDVNEAVEGDRLEYLRDVTLALMVEAAEFLDELPWKKWKPIATQTCDREKANFEICDIIVFAIVLHITLDPDMPLEKAMEITLNKLDKRLKIGSHKSQKGEKE